MIADNDVRDSFEAAYATYRATTQDPDYQAPEPYQPTPTPYWRREQRQRDLTVEEAFRRIDSADAYEHRLIDPITTVEGIEHVWEMYRHRYGLWGDRARNELPFAELAACRLSLLQWHDVFNAINAALTKKEFISETYESSVKVPAEYILKTAQKRSQSQLAGRHKRNEAIRYLKEQGIDYEHLSELEKAEWRARSREEQAYSRTYL